MTYESEIRQHITEVILAEATVTNLADETPLISSGLVDSLGLVHLLMFIQQKFGVDLMTFGTPQDFDSVDALAAAVRRQKGEE